MRNFAISRLKWQVYLPVALSLVLGLWGIDRVGFGGDEQQTAYALDYLPWRLWEAPLLPYYGVMWVWSFGSNLVTDFWLRLASVVAMAGAVGFTAATVDRLSNRRAALFAGVSLALSPLINQYAHEVRVYALAALLAAAATWLLIRAATGSDRRWWWAYAATLALLGVIAPFAYAVVPAHFIVIWTDAERRNARRPWLLAVLSNVPIVIAAAVMSKVFGSMHAWLAPPSMADFFLDLPTIALLTTYGFVLIALSLLTKPGARWAFGVFAGMASLWVLSQGPSSFWLERSFTPIAPLLAIAASFTVARLTPIRLVASMLVLVLASWSFLVDMRQPGSRGLDPRMLASIIDENAKPGDTINTAINDWLAWGVRRYSSDPNQFRFDQSGERIWVLDSRVQCKRLNEFLLPPDGKLVLCESLGPGWNQALG